MTKGRGGIWLRHNCGDEQSALLYTYGEEHITHHKYGEDSPILLRNDGEGDMARHMCDDERPIPHRPYNE